MSAQAHLRSILHYTRELLGLNERIVVDLSRHPHPVLHEEAVTGLDGVTLGAENGAWASFRRLRDTAPPAPDPMFEGWYNQGGHPSPDRAPKLLEKRVVRVSAEEASDLAESGLARPDAAMAVLDEEAAGEVDLELHTRDMPEFKALWQAYVDGPWAVWAEAERPTRRSIEVYNLLFETHQRAVSFGDDNPVEIVWGVGVARWQVEGQRLLVPLIEQLVEIEMDEAGTLTVRPRNQAPQVVLKAFHELKVEGSKTLERDAGALLRTSSEDPDVGFTPFDPKTFERVLQTCASRLSSTAVYGAPEAGRRKRSTKAQDATLRISDNWVLFVRQRAEDVRKEDVERLERAIGELSSPDLLPAPALRFVQPPSSEISADDIDFSILSGGLTLPDRPARPAGAAGAGEEEAEADFFFPLPYNEEQGEIAKRLERADGVVVQGPPGTGKTHTIANIICHYLATGRRVLVTAKTPEALTALHEKLPAAIRDLAISVIHNDQEGARQLEQAVTVLANEAKQVNARQTSEEIRDAQARIVRLKRETAEIDEALRAHAERNHARIPYLGRELLPMELAERLAKDRARHGWLDEDADTVGETAFTGADMDELRGLRRRLASLIGYSAEDLATAAALPGLAEVVSAHDALSRSAELAARQASGELQGMALGGGVTMADARELHAWLDEFRRLVDDLVADEWAWELYRALAGYRALDERALETAAKLAADWTALTAAGQGLVLLGIDDAAADLYDGAFEAALEDLRDGRQPFGPFSFGKSELKRLVGAVTIEGRYAQTPEDWTAVLRHREWRREAAAFIARWNAVGPALDLPNLPAGEADGYNDFLGLGLLVADTAKAAAEVETRRRLLTRLFPLGLDVAAVFERGETTDALEVLGANLAREGDHTSLEVRERIAAAARPTGHAFHETLRAVAEQLGNPAVGTEEIAGVWGQVFDFVALLDEARPGLTRLDEIAGLVAASGAPRWAARLRTEAPEPEGDIVLAKDWPSAWEWARAAGAIARLADREGARHLADRRVAAEQEQKRLFGEVVRLRTFLGLKKNITQNVEVALAKFAVAIRRLGKGTGKGATKQRRLIREATLDAAQAVPCWILPEWRVSEQLPATLGSFDLVVIDEASQSDITALPALLRGKRLLIVGDDKQVSPISVGVEERHINQLRAAHLEGLPFAEQMDPATSLYELGTMVFPGKVIMLREHFRCVEPIIRFSNRFYPKALIPLRLPTATERLDPPLVDIYLPHGRAHNKVNEAEANAIFEEIERITKTVGLENRSIGVISLIGDKQAKRIYDRLVSDLGAEIMERHRVMCGNAATFQGQERDIMLLSMVACPETAMAQTSRLFEQRFNVAMSRARDRLYLVRSVAASHLRPGDLKLDVIEHFREPMGIRPLWEEVDILQRCESAFERDFGRWLLDLGYRVKPKVPIGGYRIDFVVEGAGDRRLAIELDGDAFHGPERWADDMRRQTALERIGWTFWRCWGSSWIADREGCQRDLVETLNRLGIAPLGAHTIEEVFTEHRVIDAPSAEEVALEPAETTTQAEAAREAEADDEPISTSGEAAVALALGTGDDVVEVGDLVILRYNDQPNRPIRIKLTNEANAAENGLVNVDDPLARAVLGAAVDDEVAVELENASRTAVVERIERAV